MSDVALRVNGRAYSGWKRVRVTRGIESISGGFDLEVSDRWGAKGGAQSWPIREEDECWVILKGEGVIAGFVDQRNISYGSEEHSLGVSGRDKTGAMVDCSAALSKWEFLNTPLLTLAKRLAEPFGIGVSLQPGMSPPGPVAKLTVDPGETAFEALERACRIAGVLPIADRAGDLVLTRAGSERATTALIEGENILEASADYDATGRFRTYRVLGQHQGSDSFFGSEAATVKATASDPGVRRSSRVLLIRPDGNVTAAQAKKRAEWEAIVRAARGYNVTVTVQGWTQGDGKLWPINALVHVRSPMLGLNTDMLITEATYSLDESSGTLTHLALKRPDAFLPEPVVAKGKGSAPWAELAGGVK